MAKIDKNTKKVQFEKLKIEKNIDILSWKVRKYKINTINWLVRVFRIGAPLFLFMQKVLKKFYNYRGQIKEEVLFERF